MRSAAVGFQCPTCVSEGARSTRSGRAAYGGQRSTNPALTSYVLIGVNLLVFLLIQVTGGSSSPWLYHLALLPSRGFAVIGGQPQFFDGVATGAWWQPVTSMFTHLEIWHIAFNMLALYVLGPQLEAVMGRVRFLAIYLLSGLSGSAMVYWFSGVNTPTIGASGALFGLMAALLVVAFKAHGQVQQILMWIGLNFLITAVFRSFISWQGHLGGFLGGLALAAAFVYAPREHRSLVQTLASAGLLVVLLAAFAGRTVVLA
ncbi:rhomboid family intramembrane serine protease [Nocardioides iriomotensis]